MDDLDRYLSVHARLTLAAEFDPAVGARFGSVAAVLMFVDVGGYTALTTAAVRQGADAVERFTMALNGYFSAIVDAILDHGGDVVGFEGDALLALFPCAEATLAATAARTARAAVVIGNLQMGHGEAKGPAAAVSRITLAAGQAWFAAFGDAAERRHSLCAGDAVRRLAASQGAGPPGTIAVDASLHAALGGAMALEPIAGSDPGRVLALRAPAGPEATARAPATLSAAPASSGSDGLPRALLLRCISPAIVERVAQGQLRWLAEMRFVCPVFARVDIAAGGATAEAGVVAALVRAFDKVLAGFGGELRQVRGDEGGVVVVGMFGTPGTTHEDDPLRAALAACALREEARRLGLELACGVAGGTALCGVFGPERRQDFMIVGDAMNLAARLMQLGRGVVAESRIAALAGPALATGREASFLPKGFERPVLYRPLPAQDGQRDATAWRGRETAAGAHAVVGRLAEKEGIESRLRRLRSGAEAGRALLIEGEAGMGKTALARFTLARAAQLLLAPLQVSGSRVEQMTSYFVWRALLPQLALPGIVPGDSASLAAALQAALDDAPELRDFASLLNDIVPLGIAPTRLTEQMEPTARADMTGRLLLHLLAAATASPTVIVFEDAHWIDSASWSAIVAASRSLPRVLIVLTSRLDLDPGFEAARAFLADLRNEGLLLAGLSAPETAAVLAARLGVRAVAPEAVGFVHKLSAGNPFFAEELALALLERGELRIEGQACVAPQGLDHFGQLGLPETVRATILERVDRLDARQQLLLKIASVVGAVAPVRLLRELFGREAEAGDLAADLAAFEARQLADIAEHDGEACLCFRHAITQEAAYQLLTPSQKRALHRAVADWYELVHAGHLEPWVPLLAHHFRAASENPKAFHYTRLAGERAVRSHANAEAVHFLAAALLLEPLLTVAPIDGARLRRSFAEAQLKLSALGPCRTELVRALAQTGAPVAGQRWLLILQVCLAMCKEAMPRPNWRTAAPATAPAVSLLRSQLAQLLAEVAYYEHDVLTLLHATFTGLRHASGYAPSRELASAHATAAVVTGLMRMQRASRRHLAGANDAAAAAGHLPTVAYVHQLSGVCASSSGAWHAAEASVELAAEGYREGGDVYRWRSTRLLLAYNAMHRGEFERVGPYLAEADELAVFPGGPLQLRVWFRTAELAQANARAARGEAALPSPALIDEVRQLAQIADPSQAPLCRGFAADALRLRGEPAAANEQAQLGLAILRDHRPTTYFSLLGIVSIGEAFVALASQDHGARREMLGAGKLALAALRRFAFMIPIAAPSMRLLEGQLHAVAGDAARAGQGFEAARAEAARLQMSGVELAARRAIEHAAGGRARTGKELAWA